MDWFVSLIEWWLRLFGVDAPAFIQEGKAIIASGIFLALLYVAITMVLVTIGGIAGLMKR